MLMDMPCTKRCIRELSPELSPDVTPPTLSYVRESYALMATPPKIMEFPAEVLAEIFTLCVLSSLDISPSFKVPAPMQLIGVCRSWRNIALNLPRLWVSVDIKFTHRDNRKRHGYKLRHWSDHARNRLLSITCSFPDRGSLPSYTPPRRPLSPVIPFLARASELRFLLSSNMFLDDLFTLHFNIPHVKTLWLDMQMGTSFFDSQDEKINFGDASSLKELTVKSWPGYPFLNILNNVPWHQLTYLHVVEGRLHPDSVWRVLRQCIALVEGAFCLEGYKPGESPIHNDATDIVLSSLTTMHVAFSGYGDGDLRCHCHISPLFQSFCFPSLHTLSITTNFASDDSHFIPRLLDLQRRSRTFPLKELTLSRIVVSTDQLSELLSVLPDLEQLTLENAPTGTVQGTHFKILVNLLGQSELSLPSLTNAFIVDCPSVDRGVSKLSHEERLCIEVELSLESIRKRTQGRTQDLCGTPNLRKVSFVLASAVHREVVSEMFKTEDEDQNLSERPTWPSHLKVEGPAGLEVEIGVFSRMGDASVLEFPWHI